MNKNKINRGIDLGTTNSAIAVMENGIAVIKKSTTQKDTMPSVVSVNRRRAIHVGDTAANELANQVLRATKTWDGRYAATDIFKEFKRTMGTMKTYRSRNLKRDFTSEELSAEVIKALAMAADVNDGGCVVISVPAKFDANQKTATVNAAQKAGFRHVELIQEPIAAAIAYGVITGQSNGYWLVFDLGGGTFDAALLRVEDGVQQVIDTEGDSFLGGKDIDCALVDQIFLPYVEEHYQVKKIMAAEPKRAMLRRAMKHYAEQAKILLSKQTSVEMLSDLGELGCDDAGKEIELDLTITRDTADPIMQPFFDAAISLCLQMLQRNSLEGSQLTKLILVGGPTYSPLLRQMIAEKLTPNIDTSVDPMTAVAKGAALYAATRDVPAELKDVPEDGVMELELSYETMAAGITTCLSLEIVNSRVNTEGMTVEIVRSDGAWTSGLMLYEDGGVGVALALQPHSANTFTIHLRNDFGCELKVSPATVTILQGLQVSAAPLPYHIGFAVWNNENDRQEFVPFLGLEKNKPVPAIGIAHQRKTTMRLVPGDDTTTLCIPVYQAATYANNSPALMYEHVADVSISGKDVDSEVSAGSEVEVQVAVDSSEMMTFTVTVLSTGQEIVKQLDTSPRFSEKDADNIISECIKSAEQSLEMLKCSGASTEHLFFRLMELGDLDSSVEKKAVVEKYRALLRDIYQLECDTILERTRHKAEKELASLEKRIHGVNDEELISRYHQLKEIFSKANDVQDEFVAKFVLREAKRLNALFTINTDLPICIQWFDVFFDTYAWATPNIARKRIDTAMKMMKGSYANEDLKAAFQGIISCLDRNEIRAAKGLLG